MSLGAIYDQVSSIIGRGTVIDSHFPSAFREAHNEPESNDSHKFMEQYRVLVTDPAATFPWVLETPEPIKEMIWCRLEKPNVDDPDLFTYLYLEEVDGDALEGREKGEPSHYWREGVNLIHLSRVADEALNIGLFYYAKTTTPADLTDTSKQFTSYLTENHEALMIWSTILQLTPFLRNDTLAKRAQERRDVAWKLFENEMAAMEQPRNKPIKMNDPRRLRMHS